MILSTISDDFLRGTSNLKMLKQLQAMSPAREDHRAGGKDGRRAGDVRGGRRLRAPAAPPGRGADPRPHPRVENGTLDQAKQAELEALESRREVVA